MPNVGLKVVNPSMTLSHHDQGTKTWRLSFEASLANGWRQSVELTTDHKFEELNGTVDFETTEIEGYKGFEKGSLSFWHASGDEISPMPPSYLATIRLHPDDHQRLLDMLAGGLPLMSVNIDVPDMSYGWEPDGSGKIWDNAEKPAIEIKGYRLFFGKADAGELLEDLPEPEIQTDAKILTAIRDLKHTSRWTLYAFIALTFVMLWKR